MDSLRDMYVGITFQDRATDAINRVNRSMDTVRNGFSGMSSEIQGVEDDSQSMSREMTTGFREVSGGINRVNNDINQLGRDGSDSMNSVENSINDAAQEVENLGDSVRETNNQIEQTTERSSRRASRSFNNMGNEGRNAFNGIRGAMDRVTNGIKSLGSTLATPFRSGIGLVKQYAGVLGLLSGGALAAKGIGRLSAIENAQTSLTVMMGNAKKAKGFLDDVLAFAKTTPFAFPDLAETARNLIAFGMNSKKVVPTLKAIGDAAAATGKGAAGLEQVAGAFGDMQVSGKLSMDQINRLQSAGVPALKILANKAGISVDQMKKKISSGTMSSVQAIDDLVVGMQKGTKGLAGETAAMAGIMEKTKKNWTGSLDSLKSSISSTMAKIMEPAKPKIQAAMAWFGTQFGKLPGFIDGAKNMIQDTGLADLFIRIKDSTVGLFSSFDSNWPEIKQMIQDTLTAAVNFANGIMDNWGPVSTTVLALAGAFAVFYSYMKMYALITTITNAIKLLRGATIAETLAMIGLNAAFWANPITWIIAGVAALTAGVILLVKHFGGWEGAWKAIERAAAATVNFLTDKINWLIKLINKIPGVKIPIIPKVNWGNDNNYNLNKLTKGKTLSSSSGNTSGTLRNVASNALGQYRVPYDNYLSYLHKDESILTAKQSNALRDAGILQNSGGRPKLDMKSQKDSSSPGFTPNGSGGNINFNPTIHINVPNTNSSPSDIKKAVKEALDEQYRYLLTVFETGVVL